MSARINPVKKILELYRDLPTVEDRKAVMNAMVVFSGEPPKAKATRKNSKKQAAGESSGSNAAPAGAPITAN